MNSCFVYYDDTESTESASAGDCPECEDGAVVVDEARGEILCSECGFILKNGLIDKRAEWTAYNGDEERKKSRTGLPMTELMHDRGLTTSIHWKDVDAYGRPLSQRKQRQIERLRTWHERIRIKDAQEQNLKHALVEIIRMASALGLPRSVSEVAAHIYRQSLRNNLLTSRSIEGVSTSCLYIACRREGIPRSLDEVEQVSRVDRREIGRTYRALATALDLEMKPVDPRQFVPRFCSELDVSLEVQHKAIEIIDNAVAEGKHAGKSPTGVAGAAIYIASMQRGKELTQEDIASVVQVTPVTIRKRYQDLLSVVETKAQ